MKLITSISSLPLGEIFQTFQYIVLGTCLVACLVSCRYDSSLPVVPTSVFLFSPSAQQAKPSLFQLEAQAEQHCGHSPVVQHRLREAEIDIEPPEDSQEASQAEQGQDLQVYYLV